jgi:hypothetical protein
MYQCTKCKSVFRDNYVLNRHMMRLKPCIGFIQKNPDDTPSKNLQDHSKNFQIDNKNFQIDNKNFQIDNKNFQIDNKNKCCFCLNTFCNKYTKNRHETICSDRDDPLRLLEIKIGVDPKAPPSKTECRFCNNDFSRRDYLKKHIKNCKEREEYHQKLLNKEKMEQQIINNTTINNNTVNNNINNGTVNNININVFGQESTEHLKVENLIQMLRDLSQDYNKDQVYLSAGEFINLVNRYIREVPENDNFNIPDPKGLYAEIKTSKGVEKVSIDRYLEKSFKSSAKTILDKKDSINEQNERVFKSETNKEIFSEVKGFAKDGFRHTSRRCIGTPRQVRSGYKIGMLKKEEIDF